MREAWVDAKSPGNGRTYVVGTIEVRNTVVLNNPTFSFVDVVNPPETATALTSQFFCGVAGPASTQQKKQVVILQCLQADGSIVWQRYFYGWTPGLDPTEQWQRSTCARGISVWAAQPNLTASDLDLDTRIAICGEQSDDELPKSQGDWPQLTTPATPASTGFIAVFNGGGDLLWTYNAFGDPSSIFTGDAPECAITDVSIRTEGTGSAARDVVTYCGISSWGVPIAAGVPLAPHLPFLPGHGGANTAGGDTDHGRDQWDGIVGRVSNVHDSPQPSQTLKEFHSIVGGGEQDGLFGIAEMDDQRFVVVGGSSRLVIPGTTMTFPFDSGANTAAHRVGVVMTFDATPTRASPAGVLDLQVSFPLGRMAFNEATESPYATIARDVLVQLDHQVYVEGATNVRAPEFHVVGATNDPDFFSTFPLTPWPVGLQLATLQGPSDGFVASFVDYTGPGAVTPIGGGFVGGPGHDGLTGVSSWNEHQDHYHVCGYTVVAGDTQVLVASMFLNHSCEYEFDGTQLSLVPGTDPTIQVRTDVLGGVLADRPTVLGVANATQFSPVNPSSGGMAFTTGLEVAPFGYDNIGDPAGGGIAVDPTGRATVVGATRSVWLGAQYPVTAAPYTPGRAVGFPFPDSSDAVRTNFDMLPIGVGRTDGTGSRRDGTYPDVPAYLPAPGFTGGTTPACALEPFGRRPNGPVPLLPRTLVDFDGVNASGQAPSFVFTRPPSTGVVLGTVLQFGFPGDPSASAPTPLLFNDVELWLLDPSAVMFLAPAPSPWFGFPAGNSWWIQGYQSWRFTLTVPLGVTPLSVQLLTLAACDSTWPANCGFCDGAGTIVASPALIIEY